MYNSNNNNNNNNNNNERILSSYINFINSSNTALHNIINIINQQQQVYGEIVNRPSTAFSRYTPISQYTPTTQYTHNTQYTPNTQYAHNTQYTPNTQYTHNTQYTPNTQYTHNTQYTYNNEPHVYRNTTQSVSSRFNNIMNNIFNDISNSSLQNFLSSTVDVRPSPEQLEQATQQLLFNTIENPLNITCPITQIDFADNDIVTQLIYCKHIFYTNAIFRWFNRNVHCPLCRNDIRDNTQYNDIETTQENTSENTSENIEQSDISGQYTIEFLFRDLN